MILKKTKFLYKDLDRLKLSYGEKKYHVNTNQKKTVIAILISDKIDFRTKKSVSDQEGHYVII